MGPWVSYGAGAWLIDECQIALFMSCPLLRNLDPHFQCHSSNRQQFVLYPGYDGNQFYAALAVEASQQYPLAYTLITDGVVVAIQ